MKRILTLFITAVIVVTLCLSEAIAQNRVTGVVVDKHGSPVPGAMVNAKGTAVKAVTGMDGTFSIDLPYNVKKLTFRYGGYGTVNKTVAPEMQVKMRKSNGTHDDNWFLSFQIAVPDVKQARPAYGFMAGWCRGFGAYMKGVYRGVNMDASWLLLDENRAWGTGNHKSSYNCMTWGGMMKVLSPLYLYAGMGVSWRKVYYEMAGGEYYGSQNDSYVAYAWEIGVMYKWRSFILNAGFTEMAGIQCCAGNFGVGYCF